MGKAQNLLASSKDTLNSVTNLPLDTIILITIFIILLVYSLRYGKYKIISFIFSLYIAIPVFSYFPYIQIFSFFAESEKAILYSQIIFFLIIVVFFNIIIRKFILEEFLARGIFFLYILILRGVYKHRDSLFFLLLLSFHFLTLLLFVLIRRPK